MMNIRNSMIGGLTGCTGMNRAVIGIQGQQGCNRYYHWNTGCSGITYSIKTENLMNIYNYFSCTGVSSGLAGPIALRSGKEDPTQTYAYGCFDESGHGGRDFTVTPGGVRLPFSMPYSRGISTEYYWDPTGSYTAFHIHKSGRYEISYQILIKDAAVIGTRVLRNYNTHSYIAVANAENAAAEYAATTIDSLHAGTRIFLELFSKADTPITIKGGVGAYIMIKLLYEY